LNAPRVVAMAMLCFFDWFSFAWHCMLC